VARKAEGTHFQAAQSNMVRQALVRQTSPTHSGLRVELDRIVNPAMGQPDFTNVYRLATNTMPLALAEDRSFTSLYQLHTNWQALVVNRDLTNETYVIFAGGLRGPANTFWALQMNPSNGSLVAGSWSDVPMRYPPVDRDAAVWLARQSLATNAPLVEARLEYSRTRSPSPFLPVWNVTLLVLGSPTNVFIGQGMDLGSDTDGDGVNDGDELYSGSSPSDSNSVLRTRISLGSPFGTNGSRRMIITWDPATTNRTYSLMWSTHLSGGFSRITYGLGEAASHGFTDAPPDRITLYGIETE
jgi:hypothetical protein